MSDFTDGKTPALAGMERAFIVGTIVWIFLQLSRAIAIVLINDIDAGVASEAWRYPCLLGARVMSASAC